MNLTKLSKKTKEVLMNFIDENENILIYIINPYGYIKASLGGMPMTYHTLANLKRSGYVKTKKKIKKLFTN